MVLLITFVAWNRNCLSTRMGNPTNILFLHGGAEKADFDADAKLVKSLRTKLGKDYKIDYPFMPDTGTPDMGRRKQILHEIAIRKDDLIIVAHSLGASMVRAVLSEFTMMTKIAGVFILATPWWSGDEDWVNALN